MNVLTKLSSLILIFLFLSVSGKAQQYTLCGTYPDGKNLKENDVFLLDDACTFFMQNAVGDAVKLKSCEWTYSVLDVDSVHFMLNKLENTQEYNFSIDESIKEYSNSLLKRIRLENDSSVYFLAKITCNGITQNDEHLTLDMPIYLKLLPSVPAVEKIEVVREHNKEDDGEYAEYFADVKITIENLTGAKWVSVEEYIGLPMPIGYHINPADGYFIVTIDKEFCTGITLAYINDFGITEGSFFTLQYEDIIASIEDNKNNNTEIKVYPNPVKDILNIESKEASIQRIRIYNSEGKLFKNSKTIDSNSINMSNYPSGIYILAIEHSNSQRKTIFKIIKE